MLTTKNKKALCLSLLMSLTASVSAEGLMDWLKANLTPTKVAVTTAAAVGLFYHYWHKRRTTQTITINNQQINVAALGLKLSNSKHINARIQNGTYSTIQDFDDVPRKVVDVNTEKELFGFSINANNSQQNQTVRLIYNERLGQMHLPWNWIGCLCCSNTNVNYASNENDLANALCTPN